VDALAARRRARGGPADLFEVRPPLAARDLFQIASLPLPALQEPAWRPVIHPRLEPSGDGREVDLFRVIRDGDLLVHHPFDAFSSSVQTFLEIAARIRRWLAIKQTPLSHFAQLSGGSGAHRGRRARQASGSAGGAQGEL